MADANRVAVIGVAAAALCAAAAGAWVILRKPTPVQSPPALAATLGPSWTMVPLPNSGLSPGAIIQIVTSGGASAAQAARIDLRWMGRLTDCGVPDEALVVNDAAVPAISSGQTYAIDASLGASLAGVSGQLGANASRQADLVIAKSTDSSLNYIRFAGWVGAPDHAALINRQCPPLAQPGAYIVQEAFIVSQGSYTFKTAQGGKISVAPPAGAPVKLDEGGSAGETGGLTITSPIVFALKVLQPVPAGGFQVASLGAGIPGQPLGMSPVPPAAPAARPGGFRHPGEVESSGSPAPAPPPPPPPPLTAAAQAPTAALPAPLFLGGKTIGRVEGVAQPHL